MKQLTIKFYVLIYVCVYIIHKYKNLIQILKLFHFTFSKLNIYKNFYAFYTYVIISIFCSSDYSLPILLGYLLLYFSMLSLPVISLVYLNKRRDLHEKHPIIYCIVIIIHLVFICFLLCQIYYTFKKIYLVFINGNTNYNNSATGGSSNGGNSPRRPPNPGFGEPSSTVSNSNKEKEKLQYEVILERRTKTINDRKIMIKKIEKILEERGYLTEDELKVLYNEKKIVDKQKYDWQHNDVRVFEALYNSNIHDFTDKDLAKEAKDATKFARENDPFWDKLHRENNK